MKNIIVNIATETLGDNNCDENERYRVAVLKALQDKFAAHEIEVFLDDTNTGNTILISEENDYQIIEEILSDIWDQSNY